jgi:PAS domain S-box-containing protein
LTLGALMFDGLVSLFNSDDFMPHGHCFLWQPNILWLHVLSDAGIAFAYYSIPVLLFYLIRKRKDLPYRGVFAAFSLFILLCGTTHLLSIWVLWHPDYGPEGIVKAMTAVVSIASLFILWKVVPEALRFVNPAERKRWESENRIRAVVDNALDGLITITERGLIETFNPACERIFGYKAGEVVGQNVKMLMPEPYHGEHDGYIRNYVTTSQAKIIGTSGREVSGKRKDGSVFPMELGVSQFELEDGRHFSGIIRDLTVRKQTEEALDNSEKKLVQSQKMEAIGNLTGGMAHDFNNLLGVMIGNLDLLLERIKDNKEAEELTQAVLDAALRGADLNRRLLAFARKQPLQPQTICVNELVDNLAKLLSRTLGEDIQLVIKLGKDLWPVIADPIQLEAALTNLATNARDAMPHGGKLVISTCTASVDRDYIEQYPEALPGDYAVIEVTDTGTGMPPAVQARIFEPFFTTKERGKGTGLGLAMVFGFMKQSGGHINVYSEMNRGTTFRLYLPRAKEKVAGKPARSSVIASATVGGHETVLVVEDNDNVRRVVTRQLTELGYRILEAGNASAALEMLTAGDKVDLLFTDVVMPGKLNGMELAREAAKRWPSLKIVLTSGFPEMRLDCDGDFITGLRLLSKPYRKAELAQTLRDVLGGK